MSGSTFLRRKRDSYEICVVHHAWSVLILTYYVFVVNIYRLLALATCFATKMLHKYGLLQHKKDTCIAEGFNKTGLLSLPPIEPVKLQTEVDFAQKLCEIAHFLEIIRNLQCRHRSIFLRASQGLVWYSMVMLLVFCLNWLHCFF